MLVLTRQRDEEIVIGHGDQKVVIKVVDIRGDRVRIGVTAPESVDVHRREIYDRIHSQVGTATGELAHAAA